MAQPEIAPPDEAAVAVAVAAFADGEIVSMYDLRPRRSRHHRAPVRPGGGPGLTGRAC